MGPSWMSIAGGALSMHTSFVSMRRLDILVNRRSRAAFSLSTRNELSWRFLNGYAERGRAKREIRVRLRSGACIIEIHRYSPLASDCK